MLQGCRLSNFSGVKVHCTQVNCNLDHVDVDLSREMSLCTLQICDGECRDKFEVFCLILSNELYLEFSTILDTGGTIVTLSIRVLVTFCHTVTLRLT